MSARLRLSIVIPARDSAETLGRTLSAIRASRLHASAYEIIVVDDASSDASAMLAARQADTVIRLTGSCVGPAYARNRGAERARSPIVAFIDPDVLVQPDTLPRMLQILAERSDVDAVSACCDASSPGGNIATQYWNLLLHFAEQREPRQGGNFSAACGAVRRDALVRAGMFDEWHFRTACLEGLDLGHRLRRAGHPLVLDRELQVTHLRRWTIRSLMRDVWTRSILLARSLGYRRTRLESPSEVVFALCGAARPALAMLGVLMLTGALAPRARWLMLAPAALMLLILANARLHFHFARERGVLFALATIPVHILAQCVALQALCVGWLLRDTIGEPAPDATTQAYAELGVEMWPPVPRRP